MKIFPTKQHEDTRRNKSQSGRQYARTDGNRSFCLPGRPGLLAGHPFHSFVPLRVASWAILFAIACIGCVSHRPLPAERTATAVDQETATTAYWFEQPATATTRSFDFDTLWATAERVARDYNFGIDRVDYRQGVMTTTPVASRQLFELWRSDVTPLAEQAHSTLGTVRRTIRFEFQRNDDGTYTVAPKVVIERYAMPQRRVTSVIRYGQAITPAPAGETLDAQGQPVPGDYWYAIGRDGDAEHKLVRAIESRLPRYAGE